MPSDPSPRRWLVTGGQGFVGRYVTSQILRSDSDAEVYAIGRSAFLPDSFSHSVSGPDGPVPAPLPPRIRIAPGARYRYSSLDLTDSFATLAFLDRHRPTHILHLASGLRGDPRHKLFSVNVEGTAVLLEAVGKLERYTPRVVLASSGGVYGEASHCDLPLHENRACQPIDEYSVSKLTAEHLARILARRYGTPLATARIFNVLGAGQDERHVAGQVFAQLARLATNQVRGSLRLGALEPTRDFIDVRDVASALVLLGTDSNAVGIFNVASGVETSIGTLAQTAISLAGISVEIERKMEVRADIPRHYADIDRLRRLGFSPKYSLEDSLHAIWSYYRELWPAARRIPDTSTKPLPT